MHINGRLTLGENIGDNGGLQVALHAYRISLNGQPAPILEGTTGDQRFFMGRAQHRRLLDERLETVVQHPHQVRDELGHEAPFIVLLGIDARQAADGRALGAGVVAAGRQGDLGGRHRHHQPCTGP